MSRLALDDRQRSRLQRQLKAASDARLYLSTLAVLELDRGRSAAEIAEMLGVTRQSVYNWAAAYAASGDPSALADLDRCGRPPRLTEGAQHLLRAVFDGSPAPPLLA